MLESKHCIWMSMVHDHPSHSGNSYNGYLDPCEWMNDVPLILNNPIVCSQICVNPLWGVFDIGGKRLVLILQLYLFIAIRTSCVSEPV